MAEFIAQTDKYIENVGIERYTNVSSLFDLANKLQPVINREDITPEELGSIKAMLLKIDLPGNEDKPYPFEIPYLAAFKSLLKQIDEIIRYANDMLPLINNVFANYTVHGIKHSINVMEYMYALVTDIGKLSELEVTLLIYSALLHDTGMLAGENEIAEIKADHFILGDRKYSRVLEKYGEEKTALQECIRPVHGKRSKEFIETHMDEKLFLIPGSAAVSFREETGLICMSHNEDFEWIDKTLPSERKKGWFDLNSRYIAILLRIADCLDIDEQRAPLYLYKYLEPEEYGDLEWKQHFVIENYEKVVMNEATGLKEIVF